MAERTYDSPKTLYDEANVTYDGIFADTENPSQAPSMSPSFSPELVPIKFGNQYS